MGSQLGQAWKMEPFRKNFKLIVFFFWQNELILGIYLEHFCFNANFSVYLIQTGERIDKIPDGGPESD